MRLSVGNTRDRKGRPLTVKLKGPVEPYFRAPVSEFVSGHFPAPDRFRGGVMPAQAGTHARQCLA